MDQDVTWNFQISFRYFSTFWVLYSVYTKPNLRDRDPTRIETAIRVAFTRALNENGSGSRSTSTCVLCVVTEPRNATKTIALVFTEYA